MKRRVLHILICAFILCSINACIKEPPEADFPDTATRVWYSVVNTDTLKNSDIMETFMGYKLPLGNDLIRISFLYRSGADSLRLSGCVCWPLNADTCSEIWLENHIITLRWDECPTQSVMPGMLQSSFRKAVYIGADYQGIGLSRDLKQPYLNTPLTARQCIDCMKAALTVLNDYGFVLDKDYSTYNMGYSLGGSIALGIVREIEIDPKLQEIVHLKKSFCGGGPYDQTVLFLKYLSTPDKPLVYPIEFLCGIKTILNSSPSFAEQFSEQDVLSDKLFNSGIIEKLETKEYTTHQMNRMLQDEGCATLGSMLSADLINPETALHAAIIGELDKFDLTKDWTPRFPILFYHSHGDEIVPFECLESLMKNLPENPYTEYMTVDSFDHLQAGIQFYRNLIFGLFKLD